MVQQKTLFFVEQIVVYVLENKTLVVYNFRWGLDFMPTVLAKQPSLKLKTLPRQSLLPFV
jgi:hypothetical protein